MMTRLWIPWARGVTHMNETCRDSSEAGPGPRVHHRKKPPPPHGGPGPGCPASNRSVINGQNPEEESFSSSADRTAPQQMSPDLHWPGWVVWGDPTCRSPDWEADASLKLEHWRKEHRKLSFLPALRSSLRPGLPNQEQRVGGATPTSGTVNQLPASYLFPWLPDVVLRTDTCSGR
jgi:hypothetical protein